MAWRASGRIFTALAALLLTGCGLLGTSLPTYRYRLTIEVDTPDGIRTGSSVYEVKTSRTSQFFPASPNHISVKVRGEAVVVDLPNGALFAVVGQDAAGWRMFRANTYHNPGKFGVLDADAIKAFKKNRSKMTLPRNFKPDQPLSGDPQMVRFADENDPASVVWVDPEQLDQAFGPGIRLRAVYVQITDDPVTTGIEKRLTWLPEMWGKRTSLDGIKRAAIFDNLASTRLGAGEFSTELGRNTGG
jgi:hypothetical protein